MLRIQHRALEHDEFPGLQLENRPFVAVGGYPDEMFLFLALAVGEVIGHPPLDILPFPIEIALSLENGASDQSVEPAANFGDAALELKRPQLDAKFRDQQLLETGLYLVMPGTAGEMMQKVERRLREGHFGPFGIAKGSLTDLRGFSEMSAFS